jgi:SAM-dependent methyltransferase
MLRIEEGCMYKIPEIVSHWSATWSDEHGRSEWLVPDTRVAGIVPFLKERNVRTILDLGCGIGRHSLMFASKGFDVWALDGSGEGLYYLKKKADKKEIELATIVSDIHDLPFVDSFFDYILAWNVVYHGTYDELRQALSEVARVLGQSAVFQCTLLSTNNVNFGKGIQIDEHTFVQPDAGEKSHPHCYIGREDIKQLLDGLTVRTLEETELTYRGSFHWHIIAEN